MKFIVDEEHMETRLDAYLSAFEELALSRSYIQKLIDLGNVLVNNKPSKSSYKLKMDDEVELEIPAVKPLEIVAENIPLDIVYEDEQLMVINKAISMAVHPAPGLYSGTLVNAIMYHVQNTDAKLSDINGILRPGIVHRLDKDTSGLIVVAKTNLAHQDLSQQIQNRTCSRIYRALVHENIKEDQGTIDRPIGRNPVDRYKMAVVSLGSHGAREARTHYKVLERYKFAGKNFTLVECKLDTGRTHQIRVHLSWLKHPIVGDFIYSAPKKVPFNAGRPMLHACRLGFFHPVTKTEMSFQAELPEDFAALLKILI